MKTKHAYIGHARSNKTDLSRANISGAQFGRAKLYAANITSVTPVLVTGKSLSKRDNTFLAARIYTQEHIG